MDSTKLAALTLIAEAANRSHCWLKTADGPRRLAKPFTDERLAKHAEGTAAYGLCPIAPGENTTRLAVLDLDSHGGETPLDEMAAVGHTLCDTMELLGYTPTMFTSSGGRGIHIYLYWETPQDAYSVRQLLSGLLASHGYANGTKGVAAHQIEIFPKQDRVPADGYGSMFILPFAGKSQLLSPALEFTPSPDVPLVAKPARSLSVDDSIDISKLKEALNAIRNGAPSSSNSGQDSIGSTDGGDTSELDYDTWRNCIFGIHAATGGSDTGLSLAHEFSARSSKYDPGFLDERVWPYITDREDGISARTVFAVARSHGWAEDVTDQFDVIEALPPEEVAKAARNRKTIPESKHLTTDQANAIRIVKHFKAQLIVATDRWFAWAGTHWAQDDSAVYACAFKLSRIVHKEADAYMTQAEAAQLAGKEAEAERCANIAEALGKWGKKCEMRTTIDAALYLAKRMLAVKEDQLDRDHWALNCINGTVDLRTGEIKPHDPEDYITRCIQYPYDAAAKAPIFEATLAKVALEDGRTTKPIVSFLQRWFGYCATGDTREQKFVVHYGTGRNGKSTVIDCIAHVMGAYAATAAPGLVAGAANGGADKHPTEIAALMGRRMVVAHESNEGAVLREGFVKWATGSDRMTARFMREDFFEFDPTHKIQLLTNHKPTIRGQDEGIWRRVLLVPFLAKFGSPEEVASGVAMYLRDTSLPARLIEEREGVLAWVVRGAVEWYQDGLNPPDSVLAASKDYQTEQDRMLHFVNEMCELGHKCEAPLSGDFGGLYPAYQRWCDEGGYHALSKNRFLQELERVVPGYQKHEKKVAVAGGPRRKVQMLHGIKLVE